MTPEKTVSYNLDGRVATIRIDDGKRNALPPQVIKAIYAAIDRAEADRAAIIITGRAGVLSAGFDLNVMKRGGSEALKMLSLGYGLPARILAYPHPVVIACNGHCFAMGVFMMLSADYVIGSRGEFRISANEVAIGLTMPRVAAAMLRHRLAPAAYQRAATLSEAFSPEAALNAGFFDEIVETNTLHSSATECAERFLDLDNRAHRVSKRRIRKRLIRQLRIDRPLDLWDALMTGLRRMH